MDTLNKIKLKAEIIALQTRLNSKEKKEEVKTDIENLLERIERSADTLGEKITLKSKELLLLLQKKGSEYNSEIKKQVDSFLADLNVSKK